MIHSLDKSRQKWRDAGIQEGHPKGKNPGDVTLFWDGTEEDWVIPTMPSKESHYATFNSKLVDKPIIAGCPENGIILDPFCGTGTTLVRAFQLNRRIIGIDGSTKYCKISQKSTEL